MIAYEARYWLTSLEEPVSKRARFQHAYGEGVLALEDLKARLVEIEELEDTGLAASCGTSKAGRNV